MPTLVSEPPSSGGQQQPHQHRRVAEAFGSDPERYDRARPGYPPALVERIVAAGPGPDVLDVGIGTGIVARAFREAGCRVLGVDVDQRMAAFARRGGHGVEVGRFEEWAAAGRTFDAVVSGQSWHWVDPIAGAAKAAEVLRPAGQLAVFWNADRPTADVVEAFGEVYRRVMPNSLVASRWTAPSSVDGYLKLGTSASDGIRAAGAFTEPCQWRFEWERTYTREEWLEHILTTGDHGQFPAEQLDELLAGIGTVVDGLGGSFTMPYTTVAITAAALADA